MQQILQLDETPQQHLIHIFINFFLCCLLHQLTFSSNLDYFLRFFMINSSKIISYFLLLVKPSDSLVLNFLRKKVFEALLILECTVFSDFSFYTEELL
jgi:hypothetical protein